MNKNIASIIRNYNNSRKANAACEKILKNMENTYKVEIQDNIDKNIVNEILSENVH